MKHRFYTDADGRVDVWRLDQDIHNGPECMRCGILFCEHCSPRRLTEDCPSGQLSFFPEENE